jgi:hypothetical protein
MTRGLGAAIVVWGCGHAAPAPAPNAGVSAAPIAHAAIVMDAGAPDAAALDADPERLAARSVDLLRAYGHALVGASDCPDAAARLGAVIDANRDVIDASARVLHEQGATREALVRALGVRASDVAEAGKQLVEAPIARQCAGDAAFREALDRLRGPL